MESEMLAQLLEALPANRLYLITSKDGRSVISCLLCRQVFTWHSSTEEELIEHLQAHGVKLANRDTRA